MRVEIKVAIVGGVCAIIAAAIGITPQYCSNQTQSVDRPTPTITTEQQSVSPQPIQRRSTGSTRSPNDLRQAIIGLIEAVHNSDEKHSWDSGDPNPDIVVNCNCTLKPTGYSVTHASGNAYNVTLRFNAVGHCTRSKHPQGVPECNCAGPVSATAEIQILNSGRIIVQEASANVSRCICLQGRGSVYVEKTVRFLHDQNI